MMAGGGIMLIIGLLFMLLVIGLPILLIVAVVARLWGLQAAETHHDPPLQCIVGYPRASNLHRALLLPLRPGFAG